jgi:hypothetical protein
MTDNSQQDQNSLPPPDVVVIPEVSRFARLILGLVLVFWIIALLTGAIYSLKRMPSKILIGNRIQEFNTTEANIFKTYKLYEEIHPQVMLATYLGTRYGSGPHPPLGDVLNEAISFPHWTGSNCREQYHKDPSKTTTELMVKLRQLENSKDDSAQIDISTIKQKLRVDEERWVRQRYLQLFNNLDNWLESQVVLFNERDDNQFLNVIIPLEFSGKSKSTSESIMLPDTVLSWFKQRRIKQTQRQSMLKLVDTFALLIVLGAFGSLIFLVWEYINGTKDTSFAAFCFRPVLGAFLAVAMFILDLSMHSVLSDSDMWAIRLEPLYLVALGAGLLSDQAYSILRDKSKEQMKKNAAQQDV